MLAHWTEAVARDGGNAKPLRAGAVLETEAALARSSVSDGEV